MLVNCARKLDFSLVLHIICFQYLDTDHIFSIFWDHIYYIIHCTIHMHHNIGIHIFHYFKFHSHVFVNPQTTIILKYIDDNTIC